MSSLSSVNNFTSGLTVGGLATGLDTDKLIEGLLAIQQRQIDLLKGKQAKVVQEQTAFKTVEARLLSLQSNLSQLGRSINSVFEGRTVASSHEELVAAAASSSALPGVYSLRVNTVARAHQVAAQGYDDPNSLITQGTIQIGVGSASATITIDATNNTLSGLADAINASNIGVTATIINDGRSQPHRLLLTSNKTGAANAITITNNLAVDADGTGPEFATGNVGSAVKDAGFTGTSSPTTNTGAGVYTGLSNNTYTFTVATGGTVGTDNGIQISYVDSSGSNTGTITVNSGDADVFKTVALGIQVKFAAGTLIAGQKFKIDASVPTVQAATDAQVAIGSGAGALTVSSATNQIDNVVPGVTLNLKAADATKDVTLTVATDTENARKTILDFVDDYNDFLKFIDQQVAFDKESSKAGILLGNRSVTSIQDQVRNVASDVVANVNPALNRLGAIGITTTTQGQFAINTAKLDDALNGRLTGVSLDDVRRLFAFAAKSTNAGVQFVTGSVKSKASATYYEVDLTQAATQASITATTDLADTTVIDNTNNAFTINVNGKLSGTITLANGTYSRLGLAQAVQAQINVNTELVGRSVSVNLNGNKLKITSATYGFASDVTIGTGTALAPLGFAGTETAKGQDVVGRFIVDGKVETALGTGQFLIGDVGNANTADLQVRVTLTQSQILETSEANLTVTRGVASKLDQTLNSLLDPVNGRMKTINDSYQRNIDSIKKSIDKQNAVFDSKRQALVLQFVSLERTVAKLRSTGDFLTNQFASLKTIGK